MTILSLYLTMAKVPSLQLLPLLLIICLYRLRPMFSLRAETVALLQFKSQLKDPFNVLDSWKMSDSPCSFVGVTCDLITGQVTGISLDNKSLSGEISPSLSVLRNLSTLWLPSNSITGRIPLQLVKCSNLEVLNLTCNSIGGEIPDLSSLRGLRVLDLATNLFTGKFPSWIGNLEQLVWLSLGLNQFEESEIPRNIGKLKNLNVLYLADCNLTGEIPESVYDLKALSTLDLSRNGISGNLSEAISNLKNVTKIELYFNKLSGELPNGIAKLLALREIDISGNEFYGKMPEEIGSLKELRLFHCYTNNFSGEIPSSFGDMSNLVSFSIYQNNFSGVFPKNLGRFSPLEIIDISENKFSGDFPKYLCEMNKLQKLLALQNEFSGVFPENYSRCKSLVRFRVSKNQLSGNISAQFWNLPNADIIDFSDNNFTSALSPEIGSSTNLHQLILQNNRFSGEIPKVLGELKLLERLILNANNFSGNIPSEIGSLKQLSSLHLEENSLTGPIPTRLGSCLALVDLNLAWNSLSGNIPASFSQMNALNALNLSRNILAGPIPVNLEQLKLSSLDLSENRLTGTVPTDLLTMGGEEAFVGNKDLCVEQGSKNGLGSKLNFCSSSRDNKQASRNKLVIIFVVAAVLVILLVGLLLLSYRNCKLKQTDVESNSNHANNVSPKWKFSSFNKVEIDPDDICNLEEENLIGSGSTGKVYRVDMKKNSGTVAVKQLWGGNCVKVLAVEMEILAKIRHRNILKLYACLVKGGLSYLVLEFMEKGNLYQALHRKIKDGQPELDWNRRYKIALGAAKGISYLHHDCSPVIIHRDIKSSNILLDHDYEPKVADFGVAKIAEIPDKGSEFSYFTGTHGYIAPEQAYTYKITGKSDVYSFGVVLLELVTGRKPIEDAYGEGKDMVYWVLSHLHDREEVIKVLDKEILSDSVHEDMIKVLKIGVHCTAKLPNLRPSMREVVKMLTEAEPRVAITYT